MKVVVAAFNQEKALVGTFSMITSLRMDLFEALVSSAGVWWWLLTQVHLGTAINIINITNTAITDDAIACNRAIIPGTL